MFEPSDKQIYTRDFKTINKQILEIFEFSAIEFIQLYKRLLNDYLNDNSQKQPPKQLTQFTHITNEIELFDAFRDWKYDVPYNSNFVYINKPQYKQLLKKYTGTEEELRDKVKDLQISDFLHRMIVNIRNKQSGKHVDEKKISTEKYHSTKEYLDKIIDQSTDKFNNVIFDYAQVEDEMQKKRLIQQVELLLTTKVDDESSTILHDIDVYKQIINYHFQARHEALTLIKTFVSNVEQFIKNFITNFKPTQKKKLVEQVTGLLKKNRMLLNEFSTMKIDENIDKVFIDYQEFICDNVEQYNKNISEIYKKIADSIIKTKDKNNKIVKSAYFKSSTGSGILAQAVIPSMIYGICQIKYDTQAQKIKVIINNSNNDTNNISYLVSQSILAIYSTIYITLEQHINQQANNDNNITSLIMGGAIEDVQIIQNSELFILFFFQLFKENISIQSDMKNDQLLQFNENQQQSQ